MMESWDILEMILRTTGSFFILLVMTRFMGRKQLSQLTFFNYITGIALGAIAADMASNSNTNYLNGLTSLIWWTLLAILLAYISMKSPKARIIIDGQPKVVIRRGKILEDQLAISSLNIDDLNMMLREQQIFSLNDVEIAILENNGRLSIMLKDEKQPVTKQDQNIITISPKYIPMELISDGKVVDKNIKEAGISINWLKNQLLSSGLSIDDVFYVELQHDGTLYIDKKDDNVGK